MRFTSTLRRWTLQALATVVASLLMACIGGIDTAAPEDVPFPQTTPFPPEELSRLHAIRDAVAAIRGLEVNPDVKEGIVEETALRAYAEQSLAGMDEEDMAELRQYQKAWRLMRMLGPDDDLESLVVDSTEQIAGLYVAEEKRLALLADQLGSGIFEEFILAHEYVHSLQDAAFDLVAYHDREHEAENTELSTTMSCVLEGDASVAAIHYMGQKYGSASWTEGLDEGNETDEDPELPPAIQRYMNFDYSECLNFVILIQGMMGWDAVDEMLENPPLSTEQILHPEKYINHEAPLEVSPTPLGEVIGSDWQLLESAEYGEFDVFVYLFALAGGTEGEDWRVTQASYGWGGGLLHFYTQGDEADDEVLVQLSLVWDSTEELTDFLHHIRWALGRPVMRPYPMTTTPA